MGAPAFFTALRLISVLVATGNLWSRRSSPLLSAYGVNGPWRANQLWFCRGCIGSEFASLMRLLLQRRQEWRCPIVFAQVDFVWAHDSVRHPPLLWALLRRGVPWELALAYIRAAR